MKGEIPLRLLDSLMDKWLFETKKQTNDIKEINRNLGKLDAACDLQRTILRATRPETMKKKGN